MRVYAVALLTTAGIALTTASASAAPGWLAPVDASAVGRNAQTPQVAVNARGDAAAVWRRYDGTNFLVQAATRPAGGTWSAPATQSAPGRTPVEPVVAVADDGAATAAWTRSDGTNDIAQASSRPAGGAWGTPLDLSGPGASAQHPDIVEAAV